MADWLTQSPDGVIVSVRVVPRAAKNAVQGVLGDALKVRLQAPPVEGQANQALLRFLAEQLGVAKGSVHLLAGETGRQKRVHVRGVDAVTARHRLLAERPAA